MQRSPLALALPVALALSAATAAAQEQSGDRFNWSGNVPAGAWIWIQEQLELR